MRLLLLDIDKVGRPGDRAAEDRRAGEGAAHVALFALPHADARRREAVGEAASPDPRRPPAGGAALERPRLLCRLRHGSCDGARPLDHRHRRQECTEDLRGAPDEATAVHVRAQPRPRADARLPRDDLPRGQRVQEARPRYAPDCAQGAFHDYWISLRGADETTTPLHAITSPRKLCAQYAQYALACWYRYWIEQAPGPVILNVHDVLHLCRGLAGLQRAGCIAGAGKDFYDTPVAQAQLCARPPRSGGRARVPPRRREPGVRRSTAAGGRALPRVRPHAGRRARRVRSMVRPDVQRARERAVPRARVSRRRGGVPCVVRCRCAAVGYTARDLS